MNRKIVCNDDACFIIDNSDDIRLEPDDRIEELIMPNDEVKWTVYGTKWCGYCKKAKKFLKDETNYQYIDIEEYTTLEKFKNHFNEITNGYSTVPMIFNRNKFIGGYTDLLDQYVL